MKKYNMHEIMSKAWSLYRQFQNCVAPLSFGDCLRRAWALAKRAARIFSGIVKNVQVAGTLAHPVLVDVDMDTRAVTGNTYNARQVLKEFGLAWNPDKKAWVGTKAQLNTLCVKFA